MARINLQAGNDTERRVLEHLEAHASEALAEKINAGKRTLADAMRFCQGEARKLAAGGDGVYVEDEKVFGWVIHYFEDVAERREGKKKTGDGGRKTEVSRGDAETQSGKDGEEEETEDGGRKTEDGEVGGIFDGMDLFGSMK